MPKIYSLLFLPSYLVSVKHPCLQLLNTDALMPELALFSDLWPKPRRKEFAPIQKMPKTLETLLED